MGSKRFKCCRSTEAKIKKVYRRILTKLEECNNADNITKGIYCTKILVQVFLQFDKEKRPDFNKSTTLISVEHC